MSNELVNNMRSIKLPPIYKTVLWVLCDIASDKGDTHSYAPLSRLIDETCLSRNAVVKALNWLESVNLILGNRENGRKTTYKITIQNANMDLILAENTAKKEASKRELPPKPVRPVTLIENDTSAPCDIEPVRPVTLPVHEAHTNHLIPLIPQEQPKKPREKKPSEDLWDLSKIVLPDYIDREAWDGYIEMRIKKKKPMDTKRSFSLVINELERIYKNGLDPNKSLDKSTVEKWTDVYPPRPELNQVQQKPKGAWDIDSCQPKENIRTIHDEGDNQCLLLKN